MNKKSIIIILTCLTVLLGLIASMALFTKNLINLAQPQTSITNNQLYPDGPNPRGQGIGGYTLTTEQKTTCGITVSATEGPFYLSNTKQLPDNKNLNYINSAGTPLTVSGHVYTGSTGTSPLKNAKIEIWQVGSDKNYHPQAHGDYVNFKPEEISNRGYILTNENGEYSFTTLSPTLYEGRARHIHFRVTAQNQNGITTQLIFPENGDYPTPENDNVASGLPNCQILAINKENSNSYQAKFDFRLKAD
jgi:protocatechuate 3,4-dioxygenase beta subunit